MTGNMKLTRKNGLLVWHFLPDNGRTANGEDILVAPGQTLKLPEGVQPILCNTGYHGSVRALDTLGNAPGAMVCRAVLWGNVVQDIDKAVADHRTCLWLADATRTLHEFAIWCAEQTLEGLRQRGITPHPASVKALEVKRLWLDGKATNKELDAAWYDALAAAGDAALAAAWDAAWYDALAAAGDAALAAAWDAAWYAAWYAALAAAGDAARAAAWDKQNAQLEAMLGKLEHAEVTQ